MKTIYKYFKNSNTGDIISSQTFTETKIKNIPVNYFRNNKQIEIPNLSGLINHHLVLKKFKNGYKTKNCYNLINSI